MALDMNEEELEAKPLGLTEESLDAINTEEVDDAEDELNEEEYSEVELVAMEQGWTRKDDFKGNPENWKPASQYVEWGDMRNSISNLTKQVKGMKKSHNEEIVDLNLMHKARLEADLSSLAKDFERAVEEGDLEGASAISAEQNLLANQHTQLNVKPDTDEAPDGVLQAEWELTNDWVNDKNDPRSGIAVSAFNLARAKNMSMSASLEFVNETIDGKFPNGVTTPSVNRNRNRASSHTTNGGGGGSRTKKLSMSDCTSDELKFREVFATDAKFLKTVENNRKENK
jgi:hypothetical protein